MFPPDANLKVPTASPCDCDSRTQDYVMCDSLQACCSNVKGKLGGMALATACNARPGNASFMEKWHMHRDPHRLPLEGPVVAV